MGTLLDTQDEESYNKAKPYVVDPSIAKFLDNPFLEEARGNTIKYTKDFEIAFYKLVKDKNMTYVQAYNALGFDTKILGENRAYQVGKRIMQKARDNRLFTVDPSNYDGSVPLSEMGDLSPEEESAYLKARVLYLEEIVSAQKKISSLLEAGIIP